MAPIDERLLNAILPKVQKPARYTGGEWNSVVKDWDTTEVKVALAYPDTYEVGLPNLGLALLYDLLNSQPNLLAERVYAPWIDMEAQMRSAGTSLFSLETRHPLREFDILGFSLQYELNYTSTLNMLDLADIPLHAAERGWECPLIIAGGSCTYNPEPLTPFFDAFVIGEGEEVILEIADMMARWKEGNGGRRWDKEGLLRRLATIPGVYVPCLYQVRYQADGTISEVRPRVPGVPPVILKRVLPHLGPIPIRPIVPFLRCIHDRGVIEIQRGCTQGCRFCQAGCIYRPVRERPLEEILAAVEELLGNTGYEEVALLSLSSSDYSCIEELVRALVEHYRDPPLAVSLPSLRTDAFSVGLAELFQGRRRTGLTFAPEAGSQRLRDVINKKITEEDLLTAAQIAFSRGWHRVKLYFMIGLPTETEEDVAAITGLVRAVHDLGRHHHRRRTQVGVSVSTFVPKPHTPFQWCSLVGPEELEARQALLRRGLRRRGISLSWLEPEATLLEAALSRGDRRVAPVIERAWRNGARLDAWNECFDAHRWWEAFHAEGLDPDFYARRARLPEEILPWDHISPGVDKDFLVAEFHRAMEGQITPDCRTQCLNCGVKATLPVEGPVLTGGRHG
jgi:radical SAM family uncharacterized protein